MLNTRRILIVGLGNEHCGDDGVGLLVARQIRECRLPGIKVLEAGGDVLALLELWQGAEAVILVDAVSSGQPPGTIHRFAAHLKPLPRHAWSPTSTHALGLAEAVELARALNQLPPSLVVYGIEGKHFAPGEALSAEVAHAVPVVTLRMRQEVKEIQEQGRAPGKRGTPGRK